MAETNAITASDLDVTVRMIDFKTQFERRMEFLLDLIGVTNKVSMGLGERLRSYTVSGTLENGDIAEGEKIPFSKFTAKEKYHEDMVLDKHARAVTFEAIQKKGKAVAVTKVDEELMYKLQGAIVTRLLSQLQKGTLTGDSPEVNFQMAVSMAIGRVKDHFETLDRGVGRIVAFANTLDVHRYLGAAGISSQTQYGMEYLKDFLGVERLIVNSKIPSGKVIATPSDNINLNYVKPTNGELQSIGANYTTAGGDTDLIGIATKWNYERMQSELYTWSCMALWAEYLDGIAQIEFTTS